MKSGERSFNREAQTQTKTDWWLTPHSTENGERPVVILDSKFQQTAVAPGELTFEGMIAVEWRAHRRFG